MNAPWKPLVGLGLFACIALVSAGMPALGDNTGAVSDQFPIMYNSETVAYPVTFLDELNGHQGPGFGSTKTPPFNHYEAGTLTATPGIPGMRFHLRYEESLGPIMHQGPGTGSTKSPPFNNPS